MGICANVGARIRVYVREFENEFGVKRKREQDLPLVLYFARGRVRECEGEIVLKKLREKGGLLTRGKGHRSPRKGDAFMERIYVCRGKRVGHRVKRILSGVGYLCLSERAKVVVFEWLFER